MRDIKSYNKTEHSKALFAVGIVSILWGTTWLASKVGVEYIPPLQLSGLRHFIGGGLYVIYFAAFKKMLPQKHQLWQIFWMSILMFVISNAFSVLSVKYMPSGIGSVVGAIMPIWVVLFTGLVFTKVKFKTKTIVGIGMGFLGVMVTFIDFIEQIMRTDFSLGIIFGVIASIAWALASLLTAKQAKDKDMDPYFSLGWQMFVSGTLLSVFSFITGEFVPLVAVPAKAWLSIAYLVLIGSVIAFGAYIYALKRLPTALVAVHSYINPIVAIILGNLLMQEKLTVFIVLGTLITLWGVYLVNKSFKKVKA